MILAVGNTKCGVGKTTLAVNISIALARTGRDVLLIDADEQDGKATFAQIRSETANSIKLTTIQLQGAAIQQQVRQLASKYDELVIDVGGRDTGSLRAALTVADTLLVPFQPRSADFWVGEQIGALILEARLVNEGLKAFAVLNVADSQGQDNDNAIAALPSIEGVVPLPLLVTRRKAFPNHFGLGLSVFERVPKMPGARKVTPRDKKACSEILSLISTLYTYKTHKWR